MPIEQREARTIRLPRALLREAQSMKDEGESFNDLVAASLEHEVTRRRALKALDAIDELRSKLESSMGYTPTRRS